MKKLLTISLILFVFIMFSGCMPSYVMGASSTEDKGIGPKGALAILASGDIDALNEAITQGDAKYLQRFPGIGVKASSQIILDLRGKLVTSAPMNPKIENVKDALKSLGYSNAELKKLDKFLNDNIDLPLEELIKLSLKNML